MGRNQYSYPPEYRARMVELVRAGRTPEELGREFEPTAQSIRSWVNQANLDEGRRAVVQAPPREAPVEGGGGNRAAPSNCPDYTQNIIDKPSPALNKSKDEVFFRRLHATKPERRSFAENRHRREISDFIGAKRDGGQCEPADRSGPVLGRVLYGEDASGGIRHRRIRA